LLKWRSLLGRYEARLPPEYVSSWDLGTAREEWCKYLGPFLSPEAWDEDRFEEEAKECIDDAIDTYEG
jgi:hypothetical protein